MARTERSLQITDAYQAHLVTLAQHARAAATTDWGRIVDVEDLDRTHPAWARSVAATLAVLQAAGTRLTAAYLAAFLTSELGRPVAPAQLDESRYVGASRTGKPLADALVPTVITVKQAIAAGQDRSQAGQQGLHQAVRLAGAETLATPRAALTDLMASDDRITGWRRVTSGGCGACIAAAAHPYSAHEPMKVHDGCKCTSEPVVRDIPDHAPRPNGHEIFDAMTTPEQDTLLGAEKAQLIRSGQVPLTALIATSPMAALPDAITEAPLEALQALAA
jgi:hypothetical protein